MAQILGYYDLLYWGEAVPTSVTQTGNKIASDLVETHRRMMPGEETETQNESAADSWYAATTYHIARPLIAGVAKTH